MGFAGSRAEEYLHSMGLSDRHPIFSCDKSEELYSIVRDMMEHNTFGIAEDLRRNGLLGLFLSVIADSAGVVAREEEDKGNQYVKKRSPLSRATTVTPSRSRMWRTMCINRSYLYTLFQNYLGCLPSSSLLPSVLPRRENSDSTNYPIESIALSCGYSDALVFTKAFHAMKGMSPRSTARKATRRAQRTAPGGRGPHRPAPEAIDETIKLTRKGVAQRHPLYLTISYFPDFSLHIPEYRNYPPASGSLR